MFKSRGTHVTISAGSNVKRQILSSLDIILSSYLIAMFDMNSLNASNHNNFNNLHKDRYLPYLILSNKSKISYTKDGFKIRRIIGTDMDGSAIKH